MNLAADPYQLRSAPFFEPLNPAAVAGAGEGGSEGTDDDEKDQPELRHVSLSHIGTPIGASRSGYPIDRSDSLQDYCAAGFSPANTLSTIPSRRTPGSSCLTVRLRGVGLSGQKRRNSRALSPMI